jgi:hypothetical protein
VREHGEQKPGLNKKKKGGYNKPHPRKMHGMENEAKQKISVP